MGRKFSDRPKKTLISFRLDDDQTAEFDRKCESLGYPPGKPRPSRNDLARYVVTEVWNPTADTAKKGRGR